MPFAQAPNDLFLLLKKNITQAEKYEQIIYKNFEIIIT